jgi:hypothetical protein
MNNKTRKQTQIKFYKGTAVPKLRYGFEIWAITKEKVTVEPRFRTF